MSDTITFDRVKLLALRDKYLAASERGRQYLQDSEALPENTVEEKRIKQTIRSMYQYQTGKSRGLAEGIEELFFIVDGVYPPIPVKAA